MSLILHPDERLRKVCPSYPVVKLELLAKMVEVMRQYGGAGIAAPQVGQLERVFITAWGGGAVFLNPKLRAVSPETEYAIEGCLSLPDVKINVPRHTWVEFECGSRYTGMKARVIQHELDHLNGKLITDYA